MTVRPLVVGIGGTVRPGSTSEMALVAALTAAERAGARTLLFGGAFLSGLPHYDPRCSADSADQVRMVDAVRQADGLIVATPGYHGSISGLVKNALDCLEDLREDARPYLDGRAVGCIVTAAGAQAGGSTLAALRGIVHALRGWPTPFGATLNSVGGLFDGTGEFSDPRDANAVEIVARQVVDFASNWEAKASA